MRNNNKYMLAVFLVLLMTLVVGCSSDKDTEVTAEQNLSLKIGVMPAVDSLPIFLADEKGYFDELGLEAEIQIYTNAMNRQSALQTGELDGAMTDVIALVNNVDNGFDIKVTTSTDGAFPFLITKDFEEKKEIKVGMMEVSVTNYLADRTLKEQYNVEKVYINEIPARLEMINKGTLDMAIIPEPMASMGELNGLQKRLIETGDEFSPDVMVFTGAAIKKKEKAVRLFHQAYNKAVKEIQINDAEAKDLLITLLELKPEIKESMILPTYHEARVPSKEYLQSIVDWNEKVLQEKVNVTYEDLVDGSFVE